MKKISLFLALILILTLPMSSLASVPGGINKQTQVRLDVNFFENIENLTDCKIIYTKSNSREKKAEILYSNGVVAKINETIRPNGDKVYNIAEGKLQNEMTINKDGLVSLNGQPVTIQITNEKLTTLETVVPMVINQPFWSKKCPYGVKSDYTKSAGSTQNTSVSFGNYVASGVTSTIFISILGAYIGNAINADSALIPTVAGTILSGVLTAWQYATPSSRALSYKTKSYYHKNSTNGIISGMFIKRNDITYFANSNFSGQFSTGTNYSGTIL